MFRTIKSEGFVYLTVALFSMGVALSSASGEPGADIDTQRSSITIHVGKAGLFAAVAHEHWVDAPIKGGTIDATGPMPSVRFRVNARELLVRPEKGVSDKDQAEVETNMQTKVLESSAYPEIIFRSTQVRSVSDNVWKVSGELMLHGVMRSLTLDVALESGAYAGTARIKQTDFGIQPIKIGGGVVKDELEISFRVYTRAH